jgi:hypothetical protein
MRPWSNRSKRLRKLVRNLKGYDCMIKHDADALKRVTRSLIRQHNTGTDLLGEYRAIAMVNNSYRETKQ